MINLKDLIKPSERVLWEGRPRRSVTVLEAIFNPMLIFALIWAGFDFTFMGVFMSGGMPEEIGIFVLLFMLVHMMPVWIYLIGVLTVFLKWRNVRFLITTHGLYVSGGLFSFNYEMKPWTDIGHINIHQGVFDRMFGVGDVIFVCAHNAHNHEDGHQRMKIYNIPDFQQVFKLVNQLQTDVYADTQYPNAFRPEDNPGYNTKYDPFRKN